MKKLLLVLAVLMILSVLLPARTCAKDYSFPSVKITVYIRNDGSFDFIEERTYFFSGEFHWATYTLQKEHFESIENFTVADEVGNYELVEFDNERERTYTFQETASSYNCKFYYYANNETKTFKFSYRIKGGIIAYNDVADFYWKLIGTGWEKKTDVLEAFIYLPEVVAENDIKVFGHGPLNGIVERLDGNGARYYVTNVPANTYVEARVIFPSSILNVQKVSQNKLDEIMKEELAEARKADLKRYIARFSIFLVLIIPLLIFLWWLSLFRKYGKEYKPSREIIYFRDIPSELPPALVGYLMRFKSVQPQDFTATIMNLIRKGYISIEERKEDKGLLFKREVPVIYLYKTKKEPSDLRDHEKIVYKFLFEEMNYSSIFPFFKNMKSLSQFSKLFANAEAPLSDFAGKSNSFVSTDEIQKYIKARPNEFRAIYEAFVGSVKLEAEKEEFFEKTPRAVTAFTVVAVLFPFVAFLMVMLFAAANPAVLIVLPFYFIITGIFVALIFPLARRSKKGAEAYAEWNGLRKYLKDFSNLNIATPPSIALWEAYLVYSVTFGISKRVIEQMKIALPNIPEDQLRTSHFFAASSLASAANITSSFEHIVSSMVSSFNSIASTAMSSSSSHGGGGGFSGGGGGGGGGSGGGAG